MRKEYKRKKEKMHKGLKTGKNIQRNNEAKANTVNKHYKCTTYISIWH
jgi:hypothetical protein